MSDNKNKPRRAAAPPMSGWAKLQRGLTPAAVSSEVLAAAERHTRVPLRIRRQEYVIAWGLAFSTAWVATLEVPGQFSPWVLAMLALAIGGWCRQYPAQHTAMMALRAVILLAGLTAVQLSLGSAAPHTLFRFWPVVLAAGYALIAERRWAVAILVLCVLQFGTTTLLVEPDDRALRSALGSLGVVLVWPIVSMILARPVHQSVAQIEASLSDESSGLYNAAGLLANGRDLMSQHLRDDEPIAIALVRYRDRAIVEQLLGRQGAVRLMGRTLRVIAARSGGAAIAARVGTNEYALLLPGRNSKQARALLRSRLGDPAELSTELNGSTHRFELEWTATSPRPETQTIEMLYKRVRDKLLMQGAVSDSTAHDD